MARRAARLGAAVELIHDATLVHDDYVDEAATRRGRPAVSALEGAARAIAVGDYYFAQATRMIAERRGRGRDTRHRLRHGDHLPGTD